MDFGLLSMLVTNWRKNQLINKVFSVYVETPIRD